MALVPWHDVERFAIGVCVLAIAAFGMAVLSMVIDWTLTLRRCRVVCAEINAPYPSSNVTRFDARLSRDREQRLFSVATSIARHDDQSTVGYTLVRFSAGDVKYPGCVADVFARGFLTVSDVRTEQAVREPFSPDEWTSATVFDAQGHALYHHDCHSAPLQRAGVM